MARRLLGLGGLMVGVVVLAMWLSGNAPKGPFEETASAPIPTADRQALSIERDALRESPDDDTYSAPEATSWEHRLATLNAGESVPERDVTVVRFRSLMRTNALQVPETPQEIAELTLATWRELRQEHGRGTTLLGLMEEANRILYSRHRSDQRYADLMADLATARR